MPLEFDYPITRPYPWRLTAALIIVGSTMVFGTLAYINVALVGTTSYTRSSSSYIQAKTPTWVDRMSITTMRNFTTGCDPAVLLAGGMYRTTNGAFTYTAQTLYDQAENKSTSNTDYNGSHLIDCAVDVVQLIGSYTTYEAEFAATVNCTLGGNIELIATTSSSVRYIDSEIGERATFDRSTPLASNISRLLAAFKLDFFQDVLFVPWDHGGVSSFHQEYQLGQNLTIGWGAGWRNAAGWIGIGNGREGFQQNLSPSSGTTTENYILALAGSILSDLGISSEQNILANETAFRDVIQSPDVLWRRSINDNWTSTAGAILENGFAGYDLDFASIQPMPFNAYYLCHYISWKTPMSMVTDVFVATASLFMAFWAVLHVVLKFWANRASVKGNNCTCANCDNTLEGYQETLPLAHPPRSGLYKRVPRLET